MGLWRNTTKNAWEDETHQILTFAVWDSIKQAEDKQSMVVIIGAVQSAVHHV